MINKKHDCYTCDIEMVLLKTVYNSVELNLIENLLNEHNIPFVFRDYGSGGYMRVFSGFSIYGTDILVEKSMFEKASVLIDKFPFSK
ncbi:putative signal transducing protein [Tepidimicrobium xylanilyticum]|uniref:Putative signal transducing protein n=1 Tax=Tepidimicrobium xylanilyticum TaxID=1123352 RepID=A0A1H3BYV4_9FIRM|nr:DUF2007 domain-containing protein [Tepidimicrobium xylanilyticum]GMG97284.1 hypothetical protein EN5CB1_21100 [Tepidimicrobium xylanilyticum]SDX46564.1 Putative signal transducing protein [Tepidimicrobium xylanilyticum]